MRAVLHGAVSETDAGVSRRSPKKFGAERRISAEDFNERVPSPAYRAGKGDGGGTIVATGTPEEVAACPESYTGQYLKKMLES